MQELEPKEYLTPAVFGEHLQMLSDADAAVIQKAAKTLSAGTGDDPEALLQEALSQVWDERRPCPAGENLVAFLIMCMRSISYEARRKRWRGPVLLGDLADGGGGKEVDFEDAAPSPDRRLELRQDIEAVLALFDDDVIARMMVEGIMEGIEGEDLRKLVELDSTAFNSKRRLIRRRIEKSGLGEMQQ